MSAIPTTNGGSTSTILTYYSVMDELFGRALRLLRPANPAREFVAIVTGESSRERIERLLPGTRILVHSRFRRRTRTGDLAYLSGFEARYLPDSSLTWLAAADRVSWKLRRGRYLADVTAACRLVEDAMTPSVSAVLAEGVDDLPSYLLFVVARAEGIPFWTVQNTRFPGRLLMHSDYPHDRFESVEAAHDRLRRVGVSAEQRRFAYDFIENLRARAVRPTITRVYRGPRLSRSAAIELSASLREWLHDPWDASILHPADLLKRRPMRVLRGAIADRSVFEEPRDEPYVLFPLHFQPEASTLVRGAPFIDQLALVEMLAKSIPIDHLLYVKEHMYAIGRRPMSYYCRLRSLPNVRLVSPYVDSHDLIRRARLVATITGTMGWEALVYGVRTLVFGHAFYTQVQGVHQATDLRRLSETVRAALVGPAADREDLERMVIALWEASYPGEIGHPVELPEVLDGLNVRRLALAFAAALRLDPPEAGGAAA